MTTAPIGLSDVLDIAAYEKVRDDWRERAMAARALHKVHVGPIVSAAFENRFTVLYQIQEMMRAERIVHDDGIQAEIDVYATTLPGAQELSITLFIELQGEAMLREWLPKLIGIEEVISIDFGEGGVARGIGEEGRHTEETTSAVQYVRFPLTAAQREVLAAGGPATFRVDHPDYTHATPLSADLCLALAADLEEIAASEP